MLFKRKQKRVFVIGLDCASPKLLFHDFKENLPNLKMLIDNGTVSQMRSINPPITIPAWMSMCSGQTAGQMGVYGFRRRTNNSYTEFGISTSGDFSQVEKIWDILAKRKKKSILVGIPPTYPPYPINGWMVSDFICPNSSASFTYPGSLKKEIEKLVGNYSFDVIFRTKDRDGLIKNAWEMTEKRFRVIEYLIKNKEWDFFMFVEIGLDRIQHGFWKYYDSLHHLYEPNHKYKDVIFDYYKLLDEKVGRILSLLDKNTTVFVVSDHGAKAMKGVFCINEWFIDKGYLVLNKYPNKAESFDKLDVNWQKTKVWGWGGYYGRIFINRKGREAQGIVNDSDYEALRNRLIKELEGQRQPSGEAWKTKVYRPEELFEEIKRDPSDLMAYFDDLAFRSAGTVGHRKTFLTENDTGPDDAVHDWEGVFIECNLRGEPSLGLPVTSIFDFKDRVLKVIGI